MIQIPDIRKPKILSNTVVMDFCLYKKYSNWIKLINITGYLFRFLHNSRARVTKNKKQMACLTNEEQSSAANHWIRIVQESQFQKEISSLEKTQSIKSKSKVLSLNSFMYKHGLLCFGGRLEHADQKHPVILPANHSITYYLLYTSNKLPYWSSDTIGHHTSMLLAN